MLGVVAVALAGCSAPSAGSTDYYHQAVVGFPLSLPLSAAFPTDDPFKADVRTISDGRADVFYFWRCQWARVVLTRQSSSGARAEAVGMLTKRWHALEFARYEMGGRTQVWDNKIMAPTKRGDMGQLGAWVHSSCNEIVLH